MHLGARQAKQWDAQHAKHGVSQASLARCVEQDRVQSIALAAAERDGLRVVRHADPMHQRMLQRHYKHLDAHWQFWFGAYASV